MPHFVSTEPVVIKLHDDDREWISIKPRLSAGEKNALYDAVLDVDVPKGKDAEMDMKMKYGAYLTKLMTVAITGWCLLDDKGQEVPFKRERIENLDPDDPLVDKVLQEIAKRNPFGTTTATPGASS